MERALSGLHASPDVVACSLAALQAMMRLCPAVCAPRLPSLLSACVQLYLLHHYGEAVATIAAAIGLLATPPTTPATFSALPSPPASSPASSPTSQSPSPPAAAAAPSIRHQSAAAKPNGTVQFVVLDSDTDDEDNVGGGAAHRHRRHGHHPGPAVRPHVLSGELAAACDRLVLTLCADMGGGDGGGGAAAAHTPDVVREFLRLCMVLLEACPSSLAAPPCAATAIATIATAFELRDRDAARAAAELLRGLLAASNGEGVRAAVEVGVARGGLPLSTALWRTLLDEVGVSLTLQPLLDAFHSLFCAYRERGIHSLMVAGWEAAAPSTLVATAAAASEGEPPDTGMACLSGADRAAIVSCAASLAASGHTHKFKMLLSDVGRIARRQQTRDALLAYAL